jgi:hypothetical protein
MGISLLERRRNIVRCGEERTNVITPCPEELVREHYDQSMLMDCSVFYTVPTFYVLIYSIDSLQKYLLGHHREIPDKRISRCNVYFR